VPYGAAGGGAGAFLEACKGYPCLFSTLRFSNICYYALSFCRNNATMRKGNTSSDHLIQDEGLKGWGFDFV
jgi:hypothetical protein